MAVALVLTGSPPTAATHGSSGAVAGTVRASPILVTLTLSASTVQAGQTVKAEARVLNAGSSILRSIVVELRADGTGLAIQRPVARIAQLKAGKAASVTWTICGRDPGTYVLLLRWSVADMQADTPAALLTIVPGGRRSCS